MYSLLAGFSVPTQRTWLMLAVFSIARLGARNLSAARSWALALIAVLLFDPFAPLAAGFWLSFVAVGVIPYFAQSRWLDLQPEFNPYKFNSFPAMAGQQSAELTREIQASIAREAART